MSSFLSDALDAYDPATMGGAHIDDSSSESPDDSELDENPFDPADVVQIDPDTEPILQNNAASDPSLSDDAACKSYDVTIFVGEDGESSSDRRKREERAKAICRECPILEQCLVYSLSLNVTHVGIIAGTDRQQRAVMRLLGREPVYLVPQPEFPKAPKHLRITPEIIEEQRRCIAIAALNIMAAGSTVTFDGVAAVAGISKGPLDKRFNDKTRGSVLENIIELAHQLETEIVTP